MNKVTLCENFFEPSTWQDFDNVADVPAFLFKHFEEKWPPSARIYLDHVAKNSDITPCDDAGVARLGKLDGHFFVVVYPEGLETAVILAIVAIAVAAVAIGLSFLLRPSTPKNKTFDSSNNQLTNRENKARPNSRIPDIFGQVWATLDLLSVPYTTFINNVEYEHSYMCVGRGAYNFDSVSGILQIRDGITPLSQIEGVSAQVYGPHKNPNIASTPDIQIGSFFSEEVFNIARFGGVDNQIVIAPNLSRLAGFRFRSPNIIEDTIGIDFTLGFQAGDTIYLGGYVANDDIAVDSGGVQPTVHLGGIYQASSVSPTQIILSSPSTVNPNWAALAAFAGGISTAGTANVIANEPFWVGGNTAIPTPPFFLNYPSMSAVICNFVATSGLYGIDSGGSSAKQFALSVTMEIGVTPCDASGTPTGGETLSSVTMNGSHVDRQEKGCTAKVLVTPGSGGVLLRAHRVTYATFGLHITTVEEINWRDLYILTPVCTTGFIDFGNVTTIQTLIRATPQAVAISQRKLNALVTRKVPVPAGSALAPSKNAADILCAMAIDPYIGNLESSDIDITGIYNVAGPGGAIETYFTPSTDPTKLNQFCYTFDDSNVSFEESAVELATAIFSIAYRRGGLLSLSFEKQTSNSTLLFNHRNKLPKSETRTVTFGTSTDNDGIVLDYIEPNAPNYPNQDTTISLYFPPTLTATNPKKITAVGVRNLKQAMTLGWRLYNKLIGQNTVVQFDATEESALLVQQDRILVADNTRSDTQDGEVIAQVSLLLTLSQNVVFVGGHTYTIFLQHPDATVEGIAITAGPNPNQVILGTAPSVSCVTSVNNYAITTYMIVANTDTRPTAFLMSEKTPKGGKIYEVKAVNYSDAYYTHDQDVVTSATAVLSPCFPPPKIYIAGGTFGGYKGVRIVSLQTHIITSPVLTGAVTNFFDTGFACLDSSNNCFICDFNRGSIYKMDSTGFNTRVVGTGTFGVVTGVPGPATSAQMGSLNYICLDPNQNLIFSEAFTGKIYAVNRQATTQIILGVSIAAGNIAEVGGNGATGLPVVGAALSSPIVPTGLKCDSNGNLFITDGSGLILRVDSVTGILSFVAGMAGRVKLHGYSIGDRVVDGFGNIETCITAGVTDATTGGHFGASPLGLVVNDGSVQWQLTTICPTSNFFGDGTTVAGATTSASVVLLNSPYGLAIDIDDNLIIIDYGNARIRAINMTGSTRAIYGVTVGAGCIATIGGTGAFGSTGNGASALLAQMAPQGGICIDKTSETLYFRDSISAVVRQIDSGGTINAFAGTGVSGFSGDGGLATLAKIELLPPFSVSAVEY